MTKKFKFMQELNIEQEGFDSGAILIQGVYTSGKTRLIADALNFEKQYGKVVFANVKGEDGYASGRSIIQQLKGGYAFDIDSYNGFMELADYCTSIDCRLLAVDSLPLAYKMGAMNKVTGGTRVPMCTREKNEWTEIHMHMENIMWKLKRSTKYLLFVSPSTIATDLVKDQEESARKKASDYMITPDLPGKYATDCVKWFEFCGYLKSDLARQGLDKVMKRHVHFEKSDKWLTRQRGDKNMIVDPVEIPEGEGGWANIMDAIKKAY